MAPVRLRWRKLFKGLGISAVLLAVLLLVAYRILLIPQVYVWTALKLAEWSAMNSNRVDWPTVRARAYAATAGTASTQDTYPAINEALQALGDKHSFLMPPLKGKGAPKFNVRYPHWEKLEKEVGYIELPFLMGNGTMQDGRSYARMVHDGIKTLRAQGVCGWVVDLRVNAGGNMWPMLAAIGPVLGEGEAGAFVAQGRRITWGYQQGKSLVIGNRWGHHSVENPAAPAGTLEPVAVLIGARTASSGEAITIAFKGRPKTRFFGDPTWGVPTANQSLPMVDGAWLAITVALDSDRTGKIYDASIVPDEVVSVQWTDVRKPNDMGIPAARDWVAAQPECITKQPRHDPLP